MRRSRLLGVEDHALRADPVQHALLEPVERARDGRADQEEAVGAHQAARVGARRARPRERSAQYGVWRPCAKPAPSVREPGRGERARQLARAEDADVAARALEVVVAEPQVEALAGRGRDGDREPPARPQHARELARRAAVVVHVLHHLGADHAVEARVAEGQGEGVALEHAREAPDLAAARAERPAGRAQRGAVEVEADHARAALERAEAVASLAAAGVEEQVAGRDPKPLEVDGEQHAASPRTRSISCAAASLQRKLFSTRGARPRDPCAAARAGSASTSRIAAASARGSRGGTSRPGVAVACRPPRAARPRRSPPPGSPHAIASLAGKPKPSKKDGTTATRPVEYSRTSSGVSRKRSWITTRPARPKRRTSVGTRPCAGMRPSTIFSVTGAGSSESASSSVPMPFFRSSVRPTKIRSVCFATSGCGRKRSVSVPL